MQELRNKIQNLVDKYENKLGSNGIKIIVSKKHFTVSVEEHSTHSPGLLEDIDHYIHKKKERKYNYQKNRFHCIVLTCVPIDKPINSNKDYREYAFLLSKVWRAHIGHEPKHITYKENKILSKIEKTIQRIIKKSTDVNADIFCKNSFFDILRYTWSYKYAYKKRRRLDALTAHVHRCFIEFCITKQGTITSILKRATPSPAWPSAINIILI